MDSKTSEEIKNYYNLRKKYYSKIDKKKSDIINKKNLSIEEKKQKFKEIIPLCVNCRKPGGTIFKIDAKNKTEGPFLIAYCGADQPCKLNMKIDRGRWINLRLSEENAAQKVNKLQTEIIEAKLNLLFNYKTEEETIEIFNRLKKILNSWSKTLLQLREKYIDIINNPENKIIIKNLKTDLFIETTKLNELNKKYNTSKEPGLIREMVEAYVSILSPLANKIRETKYKYSGIEINEEELYLLIQLPYTLDELYIHQTNTK